MTDDRREEMKRDLFNFQTDMQVEVYLMYLITGYSENVYGFSDELRCLAIQQSIGRMAQWVNDTSKMSHWLLE